MRVSVSTHQAEHVGKIRRLNLRNARRMGLSVPVDNLLITIYIWRLLRGLIDDCGNIVYGLGRSDAPLITSSEHSEGRACGPATQEDPKIHSLTGNI